MFFSGQGTQLASVSREVSLQDRGIGRCYSLPSGDIGKYVEKDEARRAAEGLFHVSPTERHNARKASLGEDITPKPVLEPSRLDMTDLVPTHPTSSLAEEEHASDWDDMLRKWR